MTRSRKPGKVLSDVVYSQGTGNYIRSAGRLEVGAEGGGCGREADGGAIF